MINRISVFAFFIISTFSCFSQHDEKLRELFKPLCKTQYRNDKFDSIVRDTHNLLFYRKTSLMNDSGINIFSYYRNDTLKQIVFEDSINSFREVFFPLKRNNFYFITCFHCIPNNNAIGSWIKGIFLYKENENYIYYFEINPDEIESDSLCFRIKKEITGCDITKILRLDLELNPMNRVILHDRLPITYSKFLNRTTEDVRILDPKTFTFKVRDIMDISWTQLGFIFEGTGNCETILRLKSQNELNRAHFYPIWFFENLNYLW